MQTLLVDDDSISLFLTEKLFQQAELSQGLRSFQSPEKALSYVQQALAQQHELPGVILLDLNMPVLSGWDILAALQPYEAQLAGRCFIYMLTSSLSPLDKARSKEIGLVTGFIHKPLDTMQLQAIHAHWLEHPHSG
jgi:CheY-like chemotaxis protein